MSRSIKNPRIVCVGKKDFTDRVSCCALFIEYVGYPIGLPCLGESIFPLRAFPLEPGMGMDYGLFWKGSELAHGFFHQLANDMPQQDVALLNTRGVS